MNFSEGQSFAGAKLQKPLPQVGQLFGQRRLVGQGLRLPPGAFPYLLKGLSAGYCCAFRDLVEPEFRFREGGELLNSFAKKRERFAAN